MKINLNWITDQNVKPKMIIFLEENEKIFCVLGLGNDFLNMKPEV